MGRTYHRDSNGRFASGGGSSSRPAARGGTLAARSSLTRSRQKLQQNASPAQRGAVTRAKNKASAARQANTTRMSSGVRGVFRRGKVAPARAAAGAGNGIRRVRRSVPQNGIRPARKLPGRAGRALDSIGRNIESMGKSLARGRKVIDRMDRNQTRDMLGSSPLMREIARQSGGNSTARKVVQRRQERAFAVRDRGNERIGSRAIFHYQAQLRRLDSPRSERVPFRRKPMSPAQAEKAKAKRNAEQAKRLDRALREDLKQSGIRTDRKPKKPRRKKP